MQIKKEREVKGIIVAKECKKYKNFLTNCAIII